MRRRFKVRIPYWLFQQIGITLSGYICQYYFWCLFLFTKPQIHKSTHNPPSCWMVTLSFNAGEPAVFPLLAHTSTDPEIQEQSLFCILSLRHTDKSGLEGSSGDWRTPLACCWLPVSEEQGLHQGPHPEVKWVSGVQDGRLQVEGNNDCGLRST